MFARGPASLFPSLSLFLFPPLFLPFSEDVTLCVCVFPFLPLPSLTEAQNSGHPLTPSTQELLQMDATELQKEENTLTHCVCVWERKLLFVCVCVCV